MHLSNNEVDINTLSLVTLPRLVSLIMHGIVSSWQRLNMLSSFKVSQLATNT